MNLNHLANRLGAPIPAGSHCATLLDYYVTLLIATPCGHPLPMANIAMLVDLRGKDCVPPWGSTELAAMEACGCDRTKYCEAVCALTEERIHPSTALQEQALEACRDDTFIAGLAVRILTGNVWAGR